MNNKKIFFLIPLFTILICFVGFGQTVSTSISSPYSRYGLGDLQNVSLNNISMGGISYGLRSNNKVNFSNPASYTAFDTNSFVFETGINDQFVYLSSANLSQTNNYASLSYLVFGFHVTKWWGASMGLLPYSSVGYQISSYETIPNVGLTNYLYEGSGGLNQFYIGNAFKIKNFSIGFNAAYIFGYIDQTRTVSFPDSLTFLSLKLINSTRIDDFLFTYGVQYHATFKDNLQLGLGVAFNLSSSLRAKEDSLSYRFFPGTDGVDNIQDTLVNTTNSKGRIVFPLGIGGGFTLGKPGKWLVGADYQMQNWKKYSLFGQKDSLQNSWMASVGAEWIPNNNPISGYFKKVHYRIGARYGKTYLQLKNDQLSEYAVSFGLGFPLKRSRTCLNIGAEFGQRGSLKDNLLKDQFVRVVLSLSVYEFWFYKSKFE